MQRRRLERIVDLGYGPVRVSASITSPFPRTEKLVSATRDLDRGRTSKSAVGRLYNEAERRVLDLEQRLDFRPLTGGYMRWQDLFRPMSESWPGFSVGSLTRWFDTNTFFKQPVISAAPARRPGAVARWLPGSADDSLAYEVKAILPGPYTFAGLADNKTMYDLESLIGVIGGLLKAEVGELRRKGYLNFQFQEPLLVAKPPKGEIAESVVSAYKDVVSALDGGTSAVWTFFGDAANAMSTLSLLPVDVVGADLSETDPDAFKSFPGGRSIGLGVIDPRTSLLEDPSDISSVVREVAGYCHPRRICLGPGAPLDLLPARIASAKLYTLASAKHMLESDGL